MVGWEGRWPVSSHKPRVWLPQLSRGVGKVLGLLPLESWAWLDSGDEAGSLLTPCLVSLAPGRAHSPAAFWGTSPFFHFLACPHVASFGTQ